MLNIIIVPFHMLALVVYDECHYAENVECKYAEYMLIIVFLNIVMLGVVIYAEYCYADCNHIDCKIS